MTSWTVWRQVGLRLRNWRRTRNEHAPTLQIAWVDGEEADGPIDVRVVDVVQDINVFQPGERPTIEQACLRVLCGSSSGKGGPKMLYVWEEHLDLFVSVLVVLVSRMGVPLAAVPEHSALAEVAEWFDMSTNRWHLRQGDTEEVLVSDPVPRFGLTVAEFQKTKAAALEALRSRSQMHRGDPRCGE